MDISILITAIGTVATIAGVLYAFLRNFKMDVDKRFDEIKVEIRGFREENRHQFNKIEDIFSKIDERLEKIEIKMDNRFGYLNQKIEDEFQKLDTEIKELRASTYRLEGAFYNQECCVVKEKKPRKKA